MSAFAAVTQLRQNNFYTCCNLSIFVDLTDSECETLAACTLGTVRCYFATCNVKSVKLLRVVFGFQDRLQKTECETDNVKGKSAKISKIESEYNAVRDDLMILSQKIEDGIKQHFVDSHKVVKTMQYEDKFWSDQEVQYDYKAHFHGIRNHSVVK